MQNKELMEIIRIDTENIHDIRPLWEKLNIHHREHSIHSRAHFASLTFADRLELLERRDQVGVFAVRDSTEFIGYCIASMEGGDGEIDSLYILPEYRRKQCGADLVAKAESWLQSQGAKRIHISVAEGNESVFAFYARQGYYKSYTTYVKNI